MPIYLCSIHEKISRMYVKSQKRLSKISSEDENSTCLWWLRLGKNNFSLKKRWSSFFGSGSWIKMGVTFCTIILLLQLDGCYFLHHHFSARSVWLGTGVISSLKHPVLPSRLSLLSRFFLNHGQTAGSNLPTWLVPLSNSLGQLPHGWMIQTSELLQDASCIFPPLAPVARWLGENPGNREGLGTILAAVWEKRGDDS